MQASRELTGRGGSCSINPVPLSERTQLAALDHHWDGTDHWDGSCYGCCYRCRCKMTLLPWLLLLLPLQWPLLICSHCRSRSCCRCFCCHRCYLHCIYRPCSATAVAAEGSACLQGSLPENDLHQKHGLLLQLGETPRPLTLAPPVLPLPRLCCCCCGCCYRYFYRCCCCCCCLRRHKKESACLASRSLPGYNLQQNLSSALLIENPATANVASATAASAPATGTDTAVFAAATTIAVAATTVAATPAATPVAVAAAAVVRRQKVECGIKKPV